MTFSFVDEKGLHTPEEVSVAIERVSRVLVPSSSVVVIESDRSLETALRFSACLLKNCIPFLLPSEEFRNAEFMAYVRASLGELSLWAKDASSPGNPEGQALPALTGVKRGFIVKTSGTSGLRNKFILHNPDLFLEKFRRRKPSFKRTLNFFPPDSIAGVELLLEASVHGTCIVNPGVTPDPARIADLLEKENIDLLHVTPTFLNLLLLSGNLSSRNLSSVKVLAYGSEPTQRSVLDKVRALNPKMDLIQVYGMSEIGLQKTLPVTESPERFRLDVSVNPYQVKDGTLEVKSESPMVCYLNNPGSVKEGWFSTGDSVEEAGNLLRVIGRSDDVINVAGKKFHPIQLEEILMGMAEIDDVMITAEPHELIGSSVTAHVSTRAEEGSFRTNFRNYLEKNVPAWMRPQRILLNPPAISGRLKKRRKPSV